MRPTANPAPQTESAKEALRNFYCELCDRGYARISEYEAHLSRYEIRIRRLTYSSYTHSHKKAAAYFFFLFSNVVELQRDEGLSERYFKFSR